MKQFMKQLKSLRVLKVVAILIIISLFVVGILLTGCTKEDKEILELKKQGENLSDKSERKVVDVKKPELQDSEKQDSENSADKELEKEKEKLNVNDAADVAEKVPKKTPEKTKEQIIQELGIEAVDMKAPLVATKEYWAGDFVRLVPVATDLDGDHVTFRYTAPLDSQGEWQTTKDNVGEYLVTVVASDGKSKVPKQVLLVIKEKNSAPVLTLTDVEVKEGEEVVITPKAVDSEGDQVAFTYDGWMKTSRYKTNYNDAGEHTVSVTATDSKGNKAEKEMAVVVLDVNRTPKLLRSIKDVIKKVYKTGETINIKPEVVDPEGDELTYTFTKPFDKDGKWTPGKDDEGEYEVTVTVSDGENVITEKVTIVVERDNHNPVFQPLEDRLIQMGETFKVVPVATDEDGDSLSFTYSAPLDEKGVWKTKSGDNGVYTITVTVSDGKATDTTKFKLTVNAPPEFVVK